MNPYANLGLDDIERLEKRGIKLAESYGQGSVFNEDKPLEGVTKKQRIRNKKAGDVVNIGAGTRCTHCGLLHFCWTAKCSACGKQMGFNLGRKES